MTIYFLCVEDENSRTVTAVASGKDKAKIYIDADNLQEALNMIPEGEALAEQALQNWTPKEADAPAADQTQKTIYAPNRSMEEMNRAAAEYESTDKGKRFTASIDKANLFYWKHSNGTGGLQCEQLNYLANKHYNSLLNGSWDLFTLAYRQGYKQGLKEGKKA